MAEKQRGVVQRTPVAPSPISGTFTFPGHRGATAVPLPVMVRRPHTNPARVEVRVGVSRRFRGTGGTLDATGKLAAIQWFDRATGGAAIAIPPAGLALTPAQLNGGFRLFGQSDLPSDSVGDYVLTLTLQGGPDPLATPPASVALTAVRLTLDVFPPGPATGPNQPAPMPEPPAAAPPAGTASDKWFLGRTVNVQGAALSEGRGRLRVRQVEPFDFTGNLSLRQRALSGTTLGRDTARCALLDDDNPPSPGLPPSNGVHPNPLVFPPPSILGRDLFAEGRALSAAARDVAFQVGLDGGEPDGDRVAFTVGVGCSIAIGNPLRAVLVKKAPAEPARQTVTLKTGVPFRGTGTLDRSLFLVAVALFRTATGGAEIQFDGVENRFTGAELSAGLTLFAEGRTRSIQVDDYRLTLILEGGTSPGGLPAEARMTAVELTLDVFLSRPLAGGAPPLMTAAQKAAPGRFVQVAHPSFGHERAKLIARAPEPNLACEMVLSVLSGGALRLFTEEVAADGQIALPLPNTFLSGLALGGGIEHFVEASGRSAALRDTGFQLGIVGVDPDGDRVPMTALELAATEDDTAGAASLRGVRFGLWDQAYDAAGNVHANFIDNDRRRFHFQVRGGHTAATLEAAWRTLRSDRATADDAPASEVLTLTRTADGRLVSRGVMLVTDDTDAAQTTPSGLVPALGVEPRTRGLSEHRLRRARIDGFVRATIQPSAGQFHRLLLPVFDRAVPFDTTSASAVAAGVAVVTPAAMNGTASTGARWRIKVGSELTIDTGANEEKVTVTAVGANTFTATFARAHGGAPYRIAGTTDERRKLRVRVVRYTNAADASYVVARDVDVDAQFEHVDLRWRQAGLQVERGAIEDRQIPAACLNGGKFPSDPINSPEELAAYSDLIGGSPDGGVTVVFVDLSGANAITSVQDVPNVATAAGPVPFGDRMFIFIASRLDPLNETLAHELSHALYNRWDAAGQANRFFTLNTNAPTNFGIALPDVRVYRRMQTLHGNPNLDPNNDCSFNWFRRPRTGKVSAAVGLAAATATTGSNATEDF